MNKTGNSLKIKSMNIFNGHRIVAKSSTTAVGYDKLPLSNALWMKFYSGYATYRLELSDYFEVYQCQLSFAMFCAESTLIISCQYFNHKNFLVYSVYRFRMYFHIQISFHFLLLTKSMNIDIWVVGTLNPLLIRDFYAQNKA